MKTKLFTLFLALTTSLDIINASVEINGIAYNLNETELTAEVTSKDPSYSGDVIIPSSVEYNAQTFSVTSIGSSAFYNCSGLTSVTIGNSVTSIGSDAFAYCFGLTSIEIPNSVTSIGEGAFLNCRYLTQITIPNGVTSIGDRAFYQCINLTSIVVDNANTKYDSRDNCNAIIETSSCKLILGCKNTIIPNSVTNIGEDAFYACNSLTSITIPNSVTSIGESAFGYCPNLKIVTIGNSVTSIGGSAFIGCRKLMSVTVGSGVTSIGGSAFYGCTSLTSIEIPNSVTSIGGSAFYGCTGLTSVEIPNSVTSIGAGAFYNVPNIVYFGEAMGTPWGARCVNGYAEGWLVYSDITKTNLIDCSTAATGTIDIPNSVTSIGREAFYGCTGLTSVEIPNSVTSIGEYAFFGCTSLPVENNIRYADTYLVGAVDKTLSTYTIKEGTKWIGTVAFPMCTNLTSIEIPNSVTSIGAGAFQYCNSLTSVTIPESVTSIGDYAFYDCTGLTSVILGNSVTSIGENAFSGCTSLPVENNIRYADTYLVGAVDKILSTYTIKEGTRWIGGDAFYGCTGLTSITIPNSVTSIGAGAFQDCTGLTSITIPNSVTSIGENAFSGCTSLPVENNIRYADTYLVEVVDDTLSTYTIKEWTKWIGTNAFRFCIDLTSITIPNSVTSIGEYAFGRCTGLTSITIPNSVTNIGAGAFQYCYGLTNLCIIAEVPPSLESSAFYECSNLSNIYVCGSGTLEAYKAADGWRQYASLMKQTEGNPHLHLAININDAGTVSHSQDLTLCSDSTIIEAMANYGYHFVQWNDGITTNPRQIELIPEEDITFTAEFAKNEYTIATESANPDWGSTAGDGSALYLDELEISAIANYGYHFAYWNDGDYSNPRTLTVTENKTYYAVFEKNLYSITKQCNSEQGYIDGNSQAEYLDEVTIEAIPNYGYHFVRWNDDNTDNPRSFAITKDTTFTAEFAKNTYSIATASSNPAWGSAAGDGSALYLDEMQISATANYGYHFAYWNDGDYSNPRTITVTENKTYYAVFEKNLYSITKQCNSDQGYIDGNSQAEYLDEVTITAIPNYGYHFVQWSDGLKTNLRSFVITKDTTFTAEFAVDRTGTCGNDWALTWRYDPTAKALTISGNGIFAQNIQCGVEARTALQQVIFEKGVTEVGASAFANCSNLKTLIISEDVKKIGEQAFYNCENLTAIYNYRPTPTTVYSNTFDGVEKFECTLHVLASSVDMYKAATGWSEFFYVEPIGAEEATTSTDEVTVETTDNTATMTWPTDDNAASYTIQITKDGVVFCTLIFNGNGQLIGIAFAPSRDRQSQPLAAKQVANGLQFTVTGLNSATHYAFSLTAKDSQETVLASYTGEFTTTGVATDIDQITNDQLPVTHKIIKDNQIFILRGDKVYTVTGQEVK
ncbi:MAG: leucine-rich repeat protein [Paludibacteraceae bacterium]|nr:leucine-rich repeat protein [Paludibacteraceae bacterium]